MIDLASVETFLRDSQQHLCTVFAHEESCLFKPDHWTKSQTDALQGNGCSCILEQGRFLEKAGVNFSHVTGERLPPSALVNRPELADLPFEVLGLSVVVHPKNPYVPTSHMNVRLFVVNPKSEHATWWFGGGYDLTPYYPFEVDIYDWHAQTKALCDRHQSGLYPRFKSWCDEYFYLPHRKETRGVGGLFYDQVNTQSYGWSFDECYAFMKDTLQTYAKAYGDILERRKHLEYTADEREFQLYRRGRYVEFNLLHDRGTIFGLQSGGRVESILMSLPSTVHWRYDYQPEPNTKEAKLAAFLTPRDWLKESMDQSVSD